MSFFKGKGKVLAQPDNKDYSIRVDFTEDQERIHFFRNRRKDNLPEYLKGAMWWTEHQPSRRSSYEIPVNNNWFSVEYINCYDHGSGLPWTIFFYYLIYLPFT